MMTWSKSAPSRGAKLSYRELAEIFGEVFGTDGQRCEICGCPGERKPNERCPHCGHRE